MQLTSVYEKIWLQVQFWQYQYCQKLPISCSLVSKLNVMPISSHYFRYG